MLGTANDTGTYGDTAASADTYRSAWVREDELSFQNELCNFVPNGGEVTLDNPLNDLAHAIQDLSRMHVSYLNSEHDPAVLDKWKAAAYKDKASVFNGLSGYDYIERHLGYRYVIQDTALDSSDFLISHLFGFQILDTGDYCRALYFSPACETRQRQLYGIFPDDGSCSAKGNFARKHIFS